MFSNMTPQQYETFFKKVNTFAVNLGITLALTLVLSCVIAIIQHYIFLMPTPLVWHLAVGPAFIVSALIMAIILSFKRYNLWKHPVIYWWLIVFGHSVPFTTLINRFPYDVLYNMASYQNGVHRVFDHHFSKQELGLYYVYFETTMAPARLTTNCRVCFAKKGSALAAVLGMPDGGYTIDH